MNSTCKTFKEIYGTAKDMCEKQWGYSFNVSADTEPCMVLWFDGNGTNPNDKVSERQDPCSNEIYDQLENQQNKSLLILSYLKLYTGIFMLLKD